MDRRSLILRVRTPDPREHPRGRLAGPASRRSTRAVFHLCRRGPGTAVRGPPPSGSRRARSRRSGVLRSVRRGPRPFPQGVFLIPALRPRRVLRPKGQRLPLGRRRRRGLKGPEDVPGREERYGRTFVNKASERMRRAGGGRRVSVPAGEKGNACGVRLASRAFPARMFHGFLTRFFPNMDAKREAPASRPPAKAAKASILS